MRRIISLLMENEPGALSRVVGLFSQRGYNIETLNVAPTEDPTLSRLTLTHVSHTQLTTTPLTFQYHFTGKRQRFLRRLRETLMAHTPK